MSVADFYLEFIHQFTDIPYPRVTNFFILHNIFMDKISKMLGVQDILRLAQTCKYFYKLCTSDRVWQNIYEIYFAKYSANVIESKFFRACREIYRPSMAYILEGRLTEVVVTVEVSLLETDCDFNLI